VNDFKLTELRARQRGNSLKTLLDSGGGIRRSRGKFKEIDASIVCEDEVCEGTASINANTNLNMVSKRGREILSCSCVVPLLPFFPAPAYCFYSCLVW
jgi:hypothetical protein